VFLAIGRETTVKRLGELKKAALIEGQNPQWHDFYIHLDKEIEAVN
jgi:predicted GIY-YIG superfamily endonuclease